MQLVHASGILTAFHYFIGRVAQKVAPGRLIKLRIGRHRIAIRVGSPDLQVALSCFQGEFDEVFAAVPNLRYPLIIDAGGYIGASAIVFAEQYPDAKVLSLEPSSENFKLLQRNTLSYSNVIAINKALAPVAGSQPLRNRNTGQWGYTIVATPEDARQAEVLEAVDCISIESLLSEFGFDGIGILKLDIEGGEYALFNSASEWLPRVQALCIELHDRIVPNCSEVYSRAVEGRKNFRMHGEKYASILCD